MAQYNPEQVIYMFPRNITDMVLYTEAGFWSFNHMVAVFCVRHLIWTKTLNNVFLPLETSLVSQLGSALVASDRKG